MEYSIGHLSKISRVGGKKLHQYHLSGLVVPTRIDKFDHNFRYYNEKCLHQVETVTRFLSMGFSEETIKKIFPRNRDTRHLIKQMHSRLIKNDPHWDELGFTRAKIESFLQAENPAAVKVGELQLKIIPDVLIAVTRFRGKPAEIEEHQFEVLKNCGEAVNGLPFSLYLDYNQFDDEFNVECCVPVKQEFPSSGLEFRTQAGVKAVTIEYEGRYDKLWMGYKQIVDFYITNHLDVQFPSREVFLNGKPFDGENKTKVEIQFTIGKIDVPYEYWEIPQKPGLIKF